MYTLYVWADIKFYYKKGRPRKFLCRYPLFYSKNNIHQFLLCCDSHILKQYI